MRIKKNKVLCLVSCRSYSVIKLGMKRTHGLKIFLCHIELQQCCFLVSAVLKDKPQCFCLYKTRTLHQLTLDMVNLKVEVLKCGGNCWDFCQLIIRKIQLYQRCEVKCTSVKPFIPQFVVSKP